jgi:hypothetical protein
MKSDFSNWTHRPENPVILKAYAESAIVEGLTGGQIPKVVWRDGEATLTLAPKDGEQTYDFNIENPLLIAEMAKKDFIVEPSVEEEEEETPEEE